MPIFLVLRFMYYWYTIGYHENYELPREKILAEFEAGLGKGPGSPGRKNPGLKFPGRVARSVAEPWFEERKKKAEEKRRYERMSRRKLVLRGSSSKFDDFESFFAALQNKN